MSSRSAVKRKNSVLCPVGKVLSPTSVGFLGSINSAAVINGGTLGMREPDTKREVVWVGGSPNHFTVSTGNPHDSIRIIQSVMMSSLSEAPL